MAPNDMECIQRLANKLAANAKLKLDYRMILTNKRKLLIVEGGTDETFIKRIKGECVDCIVAGTVFKSNNMLRLRNDDQISCKNAIVKIITGISHFPSPFITYPDEMDKWDIYGLVDHDCDEINCGRPTPRLFITDTHDLETLLLSTDGDLIQRLEECEIDINDVNKAFFLAYQLAYWRNLLFEHFDKESMKAIACGSNPVDFTSFVESDLISLNKLIEYINVNSNANAKSKKIYETVSKSRLGKKKLDSSGNWKSSLSAFDIQDVDDFWIMVNGHDILQLLMYLNESAYYRFHETCPYGLNRKFELSLIAAYDCSRFSITELHHSMRDAGLLNE